MRNLKNKTIGIIAPSTNLKEENKGDIKKSIKKCEDLGLKIIISENAYSKETDKNIKIKEKISDIHNMFKNKNIDGIFCAKGGKFCLNLLPYIDYNLIKENPKVFGGISDVTFLLNAIYAKTNLITFHMSDFKRFIKENEYNEKCFVDIFLKNKIGKIPQNKPWKSLKKGVGKGTLIGGNLTCLTMLSETEYFPRDKNIILFIEDVEGATTKKQIKENIQKLIKNKIMDKVQGLLLADFTSNEDIKLEDIVIPLLSSYNFPIIKCHDFGHNKINCVLPIGAKVTLNANESTLSIDETIFEEN